MKPEERSNTILGALKELIVLISKFSTAAKPEVIADTDAHTDLKWAKFQVVSTAVLTSATFNNAKNGQALIGVTLQPGFYFLPLSAIKLASGTVIGYRI